MSDRDIDATREALRRARSRSVEREPEPEPAPILARAADQPHGQFAREETLGIDVETRGDMQQAERLTRRSRFNRDVEGIYFPDDLKKPGWDYQFVAVRIMNADAARIDEAELIQWEDQGWRPCLAGEYPTLAARGARSDTPIEMRGLRAYQRPAHLSAEAREEDRIFAEEQRQDSTRRAASGTGGGRLGEGIPAAPGVVRVPEGVRVEAGTWRK